MKHWQFAFFVILSTSIALAEDFKTVTGKEYKDATITRIEGDGIVLRTKTGISKVYFVELPKDLQEKFRPVQATPIPARAPINGESKQGERPQAHGGGTVVVVGQRSGRVVVVGQSAGTLKIVITGIVLLVGVVLAIIRSRF